MSDTKGFGAVEAVLILLVVVIIGLAGWYVFVMRSEADSKTAKTTPLPGSGSETKDPYAGWNTFTLKYEKATFKYPADWTLMDESVADPKVTAGGVDVVRLVGDNGFALSVIDGGPNDYSLPFAGANVRKADKVKFLGQDAFMLAWAVGTDDSGNIKAINLTRSDDETTDFPAGKNVDATVSSGKSEKQDKFVITMRYYKNAGNASTESSLEKPLTEVVADKNYSNAKMIIESFSY